MSEVTRWAAGLMIGTSLDGIDAAVVGFDDDLRTARVAGHRTLALEAVDPERLRAIASGATTTAGELSALGFALVDDHFRAVQAACAAAGVPRDALHWVAAHGVTLWHAPAERGGHGWQLLPGAALAARLDRTVVHDFRSADLALGGHGAPLAPIADRRLRSSPDEDRVVLNLGGVANLSALPAGGERVFAADVGPANLPLDELVRRHDPGGPGYDLDGAMAAAGTPIEEVLERLAGGAWLRAPVPRSWGREEFGPAWVDALEALVPGAALADRLATVVALEARAVAWLLEHGFGAWRRAEARPLHVLVTGGGRHNAAMMRALASALPAATVDGIEIVGEDADAKEAVDFALLGGLCLRREPSGAASTTGARHDAVLGSVSWGRRPDGAKSSIPQAAP